MKNKLFPFPYTPEAFTYKEKKILSNFFTNIDQPVFAIHNLPQEVVGAMFSRYSRTSKSVRRLFLDEFWADDLGFSKDTVDMSKAKARTQNFYRKVFAEYGDDSVIQMGSVHIAFEYVSQLAVKVVEDQRIGAAYIEKSTRYVDFGSKVNGHYLYMEPVEIKNSKYYSQYKKWAEYSFSSYKQSINTTQRYLRKKFPLAKQSFINPSTGKKYYFKDVKDAEEKEKLSNAYERALKAKTFDTVRYFLPMTMVSNFGAHFSGQSVENAVNKMLISPIEEVQIIGQMALNELQKVSPNFLQNVDHRYGDVTRSYRKEIDEKRNEIAARFPQKITGKTDFSRVRLIDFDTDADIKLASQILFTGQKDNSLSKAEIVNWAKKVKKREIKRNGWSTTLLSIILDSLPNRKETKINRRHKLPRAFEQTFVEIEFFTDYGVYKDLQRNRMSSTERQILTGNKVVTPKEYKQKGMEKVLERYKKLSKMTKILNKELAKDEDLSLAAASQYVTIHGSKVRFNVRANLRQWVFFAELRTISGGHPTYRNVMQDAVKEIIKVMPFAKDLFANVDWRRDYGLGRLTAEVRTQEKLAKIADSRN